MRRPLMWCCFCLMLFACTATAEQLGTQERSFRVKYKDGTVELYKIRWIASRSINTVEEGEPAKPLEGKPFDTRRCRWNIDGGIMRRVLLVNKSGQEFAHDALTKVFTADFRNEGSSFVLLNGGRPENCNDAAPRRDSDFADAKRKIMDAFSATVEHDLAAVKKALMKDGATVEAVS